MIQLTPTQVGALSVVLRDFGEAGEGGCRIDRVYLGGREIKVNFDGGARVTIGGRGKVTRIR